MTYTSSSSSSTTVVWVSHQTHPPRLDFDGMLARFHKEWLDLSYDMLGHMAGMVIGEALIIWYLLWRFLP